MSPSSLLWVVVVVLVVVWALGLGGVYHVPGSPHLIHVLLLLIAACILMNVLRRPPP